jgi:hypothetical protein
VTGGEVPRESEPADRSLPSFPPSAASESPTALRNLSARRGVKSARSSLLTPDSSTGLREKTRRTSPPPSSALGSWRFAGGFWRIAGGGNKSGERMARRCCSPTNLPSRISWFHGVASRRRAGGQRLYSLADNGKFSYLFLPVESSMRANPTGSANEAHLRSRYA